LPPAVTLAGIFSAPGSTIVSGPGQKASASFSASGGNPATQRRAMTWLATSTQSQDLSQGYPAYAPAAKSWIAQEDTGTLFASPLAPAFATSAGEVWPGFAQSPWNTGGLWSANVLPALTSGSSFSSQIPVFASQISSAAALDGFQVKS